MIVASLRNTFFDNWSNYAIETDSMWNAIISGFHSFMENFVTPCFQGNESRQVQIPHRRNGSLRRTS